MNKPLPINAHRNRLSRRGFLRYIGAGSSLLLLEGCAGKSPAPNISPLVEPAKDGASANPKAPAAISQGGTIKWAHFYSSLTAEQEAALGVNAAQNREWMSGIVRQFEAENRGWKVELEDMPHDQLDQRSAYDFNANVSHDLVFSTPQLLARHRKIGDLMDLAPFLAGLSRTDREDLGWSGAWQAGWFEGQQFGVPVGLQAHALAFQRDLCRQANVDIEKPGQSLDGIVEIAGKLTAADHKTWGLAVYLGPDRATAETIYAPLVWHFGGDIYAESRKVATLTSDANQKAIQWLLDLVYTHKVTPAARAGEEPARALAGTLAGGQAALALGFASDWINALQAGGLVSGCLPAGSKCRADRAGIVPLPTAGQAAVTAGRCLSVHSLSRQPEMALKLLQVILRPENLRAYPDAGLPARLSAWKAAEYKTPFYQAWLQAARKGRAMPRTPYYWELAGTLGATVAKIMARKVDAAQALAEAEEQWNSRYAGD